MSGSALYPIGPVVREHVRRVLFLCRGNKSLCARLLGVHRRTLQRWLTNETISVAPSARD